MSDRDLLGDTLFKIFGSAELTGEQPLAGHSPEAREAWKRQLEGRKRAKEQRRERHPDN